MSRIRGPFSIHQLVFTFCVGSILMAQPIAHADEPNDVTSALKRKFSMKTLGGTQFWGDAAVFHDWRIQQNVITGHYRLLDGEDYRHASGTLEECQAKLEAMKESQKLEPMTGEAVILIHGIVRSSKSFGPMTKQLKEDGYVVVGFDYPSTRISIQQAADYLESVIDSMKDVEKIHFVVHSMGGLVLRTYLDENEDKRFGRIVMLGVPNLGAQMADRLQDNWFYRTIYGPAGQELVSAETGTIAKLPTPKQEFGIIAGARGHEDGWNLLVPGDDDGTVSLASTKLPGAADFVTVKCLHSWLMGNREVIAYTQRFLESGRFREEGDAQPIPVEENE